MLTARTELTDMMIETFTTEYLEKLFYFCLKKTGSPDKAEDLASDISVNILSQLRKGRIPDHFSAWVWRIAKNRYCAWSAEKHKQSEAVSGAGFDELELADCSSFEDELFISEELKVLRRELAFISKDYREIIVAFYIEDKKVETIANELGVPKGTVTSKLFRARNILKEGMNMAREFGKLSYKPENVDFAASGSQPSGLPWRVVQRQIPKNILLHASNNPSTIEELSVELGIAMPYMEEEVEILTQATLLKKIGDKYITNFFIADKECKLSIYKAQKDLSSERSNLLDKIIEEKTNEIRKLGIVKDDIPDSELKWWLILHSIDTIVESLDDYNINFPVIRDSGETWGFLGYERVELPQSTNMGHNGNGDGETMYWAYKISSYNLWNRAGEMSYNQTIFLGDVIRKNRKTDTFSDIEKSFWRRINGVYAHSDEDGNVIPDIILINGSEKLKQIADIIKSHALYEKLYNNIKATFDNIVNILRANSNEVLSDQLKYCASMNILDIRMITVHDLVNAGKLIVPTEPDKSTIAMALILK